MATSIKDIRQERADIMREQVELKAEGRKLLEAGLLEENMTRDGEIHSKLQGMDERLAVLAQGEARWEEYKLEEMGKPVLTEGRDGTESQRGGFESFGQMLAAVRNAEVGNRYVDPRLAPSQIGAITGLNESAGAEGGFLVGEDTSNELLRTIHETGILVSRVSRRTISSAANRMRIRAVNETSRVDGSRMGGIRVYRDGEGDTATKSAPDFNMIDLELKKLTGLFYATEELMQDHPMLTSEVSAWFNEEFGFKIDDEILNGNGVAQMLGILQSDALVTVAKESGQAANTVITENIVNMYSRMFAPNRANAVWYINQDIEPQLFTMSLAVGTGGVPVYLPANGISGSPFATLMGRPIIPLEQCKTLGTVGDILFADLSQYIMAEKGGMQSATSIHVKFLEGETAIRFIMRNDGKPRWKNVLTPHSGSTNTLSPFVGLATRS